MKTSRLLFTLLLLACNAFAATTNGSQKPNIVFVLFDDMGYGHPL